MAAAAFALPTPLRALETPPELRWKDLRPLPARGLAYSNIAPSHDANPNRYYRDPRAYMVEKRFDGQRIRLPGYLIPIRVARQDLHTEFLLVPFVGACLHVPPPPPNQMVYAASDTPFEINAYFTPAYAEGTLHARLVETDLGYTAYSLSVDRFESV